MVNNHPRLSKTGIEYFRSPEGSPGYVWNFLSGCQHKEQGKCPPVPCWAEELAGRFKGHYPNGFAPTFYPEAFLSPLALKKPARIGVCFMGDLFGDWLDNSEDYGGALGSDEAGNFTIKGRIIDTIEKCSQHTFVFLTKNPAAMIKWGGNENEQWPDNCEVGFSAWSPESFINGLREITKVGAKVRWCSLEPLLYWSTHVSGNAWELLDWVAIGALTGNKKQVMETARLYPALTPWKLSEKNNRWGLMPPVAWLKNIVEACDATVHSEQSRGRTKVFIKDNLYTWLMEIPHDDLYWYDMSNLRQECGARE